MLGFSNMKSRGGECLSCCQASIKPCQNVSVTFIENGGQFFKYLKIFLSRLGDGNSMNICLDKKIVF